MNELAVQVPFHMPIWVKPINFKAQEMGLKMKRIGILIGCLWILTNCTQEDVLLSADDITTPINQENSESLYEQAPFPVGNIWAAGHPTWGDTKGTDLGGPNNVWDVSAFGPLSTVVQKDLSLPLEDELLALHFNSITPEVALKPHNISITPDSIDFSEADAMMAFAEAHGIRVHGHILVFDKSVPEWALEYEANDTWTEQQWENWLEGYITEVVGRYRGRIPAWDVVNEVGQVFGGGLNQDYFWYRVIGPDYIEKSFRWAEAADPDALLFLNDFALAFFPQKLNETINLADQLRAAGCKVDGIGFQGHLPLPLLMANYGPNKAAYRKASNAGYLVHLSELDIAVNALGQTSGQTQLQHRIQRLKYNEIARAYLDGVSPENQWGITIWNISDRNSFYNTVQLWFDLRLFGGQKDFPMLWDEHYQQKPAFFGFRNGLRGVAEGWLNPPLFDNSRTADEAISHDRLQEITRSEGQLLIELFGLDESEAQRIVSTTLRENYVE